MSALREALGADAERLYDGETLAPRSTQEVVTLCKAARENDVRLAFPGDAEDGEPVSLERMRRILGDDAHSGIVHVQAGARLSEIDETLRTRGRTLGIRPGAPDAPLGAFIALGADGVRATADDPVAQWIAGITWVLRDGRVVSVRPAPRRAVGPDLVGAVAGGRAALGIIVSAHMVTRPRVEQRAKAYLFASQRDAAIALAALRRDGVRPAHAALVDVAEGCALRLWLESQDARGAVEDELVAARVEERRGVTMALREAPAVPTKVATPADATWAALAATL